MSGSMDFSSMDTALSIISDEAIRGAENREKHTEPARRGQTEVEF